ncbi:Dual specificity protein phosphatase 19 [Pelomyxa schiedti]|nr:Dual specificity protein phosphatase 19 [Pelomyxa schiedti]
MDQWLEPRCTSATNGGSSCSNGGTVEIDGRSPPVRRPIIDRNTGEQTGSGCTDTERPPPTLPLSDLVEIELGDNVSGAGGAGAMKTVSIANCGLCAVPQLVFSCGNLTCLRLNNNSLQEFPTALLNLRMLQTLDLDNNNLAHLPSEISSLSKLTSFFVARNKLRTFPFSSFLNMPEIDFVNIGYNYINISNLRQPEAVLVKHAFMNTGNQLTPERVVEGLYIGSVFATEDHEEVRKLGISHVLDVGVPPKSKLATVSYEYIELQDFLQENLLCVLPKCNAFIHNVIHTQNGRVLVHCAAGQSRSAAIVIGYLIKHCGMTFESAFTHLKQIRPVVNPNRGFISQLTTYESSN